MSPRLDETRSPSANRSKGFLICGTRFTPLSVQFKPMISSSRRFSAISAASHLLPRACESSSTFTANSLRTTLKGRREQSMRERFDKDAYNRTSLKACFRHAKRATADCKRDDRYGSPARRRLRLALAALLVAETIASRPGDRIAASQLSGSGTSPTSSCLHLRRTLETRSRRVDGRFVHRNYRVQVAASRGLRID